RFELTGSQAQPQSPRSPPSTRCATCPYFCFTVSLIWSLFMRCRLLVDKFPRDTLAAARSGTASGMLARLHVGRELRDFGERLTIQRVVAPAPVPTIAHEPRILERFQMEGQTRLRAVEHVLQLAHAALAVREQPHDLEPGLVRERVEPPGGPADVGERGRGHDRGIYQIILIYQREGCSGAPGAGCSPSWPD